MATSRRHLRPSSCTTTPRRPTPENDIAESIETTDNQNFTVKLKDYKFQDGTEVKSKNFVDAWNYAAYGPNAQLGAYFMEPIEGYADLQCEDPDARTARQRAPTPRPRRCPASRSSTTTPSPSRPPRRSRTFRFVSATRPSRPLPDAFFADPKAFGDKPIGAGPYKVDAWTKNSRDQAVEVRRLLAAIRWQTSTTITFKIYQDPDAAYDDVQANKLDVTDEIPASAQIDDKYKTTFPTATRQKPSASSRRSPRPRPRSTRTTPTRDQQGHLDGDRPRDHHQADLQRHA